jgi:hypothetical protein
MPRAVSIHIGVNVPSRRGDLRPGLEDSETAAWRMAELAHQAKYDSMLVLRGATATVGAVKGALENAADLLESGDLLLVTYSGHGNQVVDVSGDEPSGLDQAWSLYDDDLLDDDLFKGWRQFRPGVRIVVVSESCYSGGMERGEEDDEPLDAYPSSPMGRRPRGEPDWVQEELTRIKTASAKPLSGSDEISASVLILSASKDNEPSQGALFTKCLLEIWDQGRFDGDYNQLREKLKKEVQRGNPFQEPLILRLGAAEPDLALDPAFRRTRHKAGASPASAPPAPPQNGGSPRRDAYADEADLFEDAPYPPPGRRYRG